MLSKPKHQDQSDVYRTYPFFLAFMALVCQLDVRENILGKKLENMSWIRPVKFESRCMIFCYQLGLTISVFSVLQRIHWFLLTSRYFLIENVKFVPSFYHISPDIPACFVTFLFFIFNKLIWKMMLWQRHMLLLTYLLICIISAVVGTELVIMQVNKYLKDISSISFRQL